MPMTKRPCMVCKEWLLKGFFKHRNDPICMQCAEDVRDQRRLLTEKYRQEDRALKESSK